MQCENIALELELSITSPDILKKNYPQKTPDLQNQLSMYFFQPRHPNFTEKGQQRFLL